MNEATRKRWSNLWIENTHTYRGQLLLCISHKSFSLLCPTFLRPPRRYSSHFSVNNDSIKGMYCYMKRTKRQQQVYNQDLQKRQLKSYWLYCTEMIFQKSTNISVMIGLAKPSGPVRFATLLAVRDKIGCFCIEYSYSSLTRSTTARTGNKDMRMYFKQSQGRCCHCSFTCIEYWL